MNTASVALRSAVKNDPVDVAFVNDAVTAVRRLEKKLDDVAFVVDALTAKRFVEVLFVDDEFVKRPFVAKRLVEVLLVDELFVVMRLEIVVVASVEVPVTDSVPVA